MVGQDNSNNKVLNPGVPGAAGAAFNVKNASEDAELRKRVDARTEYLNSIKLLLS